MTGWVVTAALFPLVVVYTRHLVHRFQWQRRKDAQIAVRNARVREDAYWTFRALEYLSALALRRERLGYPELRLVADPQRFSVKVPDSDYYVTANDSIDVKAPW